MQIYVEEYCKTKVGNCRLRPTHQAKRQQDFSHCRFYQNLLQVCCRLFPLALKSHSLISPSFCRSLYLRMHFQIEYSSLLFVGVSPDRFKSRWPPLLDGMMKDRFISLAVSPNSSANIAASARLPSHFTRGDIGCVNLMKWSRASSFTSTKYLSKTLAFFPLPGVLPY